jgi:general secretion pathway protein I
MKENGRGFTLLEVMIALAVIGGLLVTVIYTLNYHLGIAQRHETVTVASLLAKAKIGEMETGPFESEGAFPDPYSDYHYVTGIKGSSYYPGMSEIWVIVSGGDEKVKFAELIETPG